MAFWATYRPPIRSLGGLSRKIDCQNGTGGTLVDTQKGIWRMKGSLRFQRAKRWMAETFFLP